VKPQPHSKHRAAFRLVVTGPRASSFGDGDGDGGERGHEIDGVMRGVERYLLGPRFASFSDAKGGEFQSKNTAMAMYWHAAAHVTYK
jgi:hypothetical protein